MSKDEKTGKRDKTFSFWEALIAIGALTTSGAAVYIAWDQATTMRIEQHASVLPAIQIDRFEIDEGASVAVGFDIANAGVGPAFLMNATLTDNGEVVTGYEHLSGVVPPNMRLDATQLSGRVIAPGVQTTALRMRWRMDAYDPAPKRDIYIQTGGLTLEICYCSTLQRCWVSRSGQRSHPKEVDSCKPPEEGLF